MDRDLSRAGLRVHVFLFNNQVFRDCYGVVPYVKEREVCYESYPHTLLALEPRWPGAAEALKGLEGRNYRLTLLDEAGSKLLTVEGRLRLSRSPLTPLVAGSEERLPASLPEARQAVVEVGGLREHVRLPPQVRVYGRVTDFKGRPRRAYVELVQPYGFPGGTAITRTRGDGAYEMTVPSAVYHHAFVCDGGYARTSLEFYAWRVPVDPPEHRLDARFDRIEVYGLTAAATPERTLVAKFIVWDIAYTGQVLERIYREKGRVDVEDVCTHDTMPPLEPGNVEAYLDDTRLEVRTLATIPHSVRDYGADCNAKAYLMEAKIPPTLPRGRYTLRLTIHLTVDGAEEWGEALLYGVEVL